jgi:hypothetical protein
MTTARGTITSRLLVNATVDPDEAAARLPLGLRPHVTPDGTVVGCCLLDIADIRPAGFATATGRHLRAAAHRMSVEWETRAGDTITGVYVLVRHTDSRLAVLLGGRWFPGIHQRAVLEFSTNGRHETRSVRPVDGDLAIDVTASIPRTVHDPALGEVASACLDADVALSPAVVAHWRPRAWRRRIAEPFPWSSTSSGRPSSTASPPLDRRRRT